MDHFLFILGEDEDLLVGVVEQGDPAVEDLIIRLGRQGTAEAEQLVERGVQPYHTLALRRPGAGIYELSLQRWPRQRRELPYQLNVQRVASAAVCMDDALEDNDSLEQALPLRTGGRPQRTVLGGLQICPGDEDWFRLDLHDCIATEFQARVIIRDVALDLDLELLDAEGLLACPLGCRSQEEAGRSELVSRVRLEPGIYHLRVFGFAAAVQGSYELQLEYTAQQVCTPMGEPGELAVGVQVRRKKCAGEDNVWCFAHPGGSLRVLLQHHFLDGDLDLTLVDEQRAFLGESAGVDDVECIFLAGQDAGRYCAIVSGPENEYRLQVDGLACP
ncbi:MAG: hypothetical protein FJ125_14620 [Deltaproteobacteria bacterium]|nr:hypothetical protein [Deltaproteobacteria bacterium]